MKNIKLNHIYLVLLTFFLCNCTSTIESRIQENPKLYSALTGKEKKAVSNGLILRGMSQDAVYIAWGRPSGVKEGNSNGIPMEKWRYSSLMPVMSQRLHYTDYHYYQHYEHGSPFYHSTNVGYIPYTSAIVEFENNKVKSWEQEK